MMKMYFFAALFAVVALLNTPTSYAQNRFCSPIDTTKGKVEFFIPNDTSQCEIVDSVSLSNVRITDTVKRSHVKLDIESVIRSYPQLTYVSVRFTNLKLPVSVDRLRGTLDLVVYSHCDTRQIMKIRTFQYSF